MFHSFFKTEIRDKLCVMKLIIYEHDFKLERVHERSMTSVKFISSVIFTGFINANVKLYQLKLEGQTCASCIITCGKSGKTRLFLYHC